MFFTPLTGRHFQTAPEPEAPAFDAGLALDLFQSRIVSGIRLDLDDYGQSCPDQLLVEHLVTAVDVCQKSTIAILSFLIEFQPQRLAETKSHGMSLGLGTILLTPFRGINAYEANLLGMILIHHQNRVAVDEIQELDVFGVGEVWQDKQDEKQTDNDVAKRHRNIIYDFHDLCQSCYNTKDFK